MRRRNCWRTGFQPTHEWSKPAREKATGRCRGGRTFGDSDTLTATGSELGAATVSARTAARSRGDREREAGGDSRGGMGVKRNLDRATATPPAAVATAADVKPVDPEVSGVVLISRRRWPGALLPALPTGANRRAPGRTRPPLASASWPLMRMSAESSRLRLARGSGSRHSTTGERARPKWKRAFHFRGGRFIGAGFANQTAHDFPDGP